MRRRICSTAASNCFFDDLDGSPAPVCCVFGVLTGIAIPFNRMILLN